ncbi:MAG: drug/metabolite transporter (DMT)-like permease [Alphaproteobacteria bacterium]|jgi:drug/metabolite transporter (DMT)-like permease
MAGQFKGIICLIIAGAILAFTDALSKHLTADFPPGEIMFFRAVFVFIPIVIMTWRNGGMASIRVVNWKGQLARGLCALTTSFLFMVAVKQLPLADITAIVFSSPIILTVLAPYFLGEHVGWRRWVAVIVGFCGILVMVRPSGDAVLWPSMLALAATVMVSFRDIATRRLAKTDTANSIMVCTTGCVALGGLATIFLGWRMPDQEGFALLMFTGTLQGIGHYFLVAAFLHGEAVVVAPFRYFAMLWASLYGYLFFNDVPGPTTIIGASIVIASGLFIFYRETQQSRRR